jgi:hypothetical protein
MRVRDSRVLGAENERSALGPAGQGAGEVSDSVVQAVSGAVTRNGHDNFM